MGGGSGGGGGGRVRLGGGGFRGGCERRIEVFVKIKKKIWGGGGGKGGCERRIKVFVKIKKKISQKLFLLWGGGGFGLVGWGSGWM